MWIVVWILINEIKRELAFKLIPKLILLNDKQIESFIQYYNSYHHGYNATEGGDDNPHRAQRGEKNGRALLTEQDVIYIRECYNAHIPFKQVYEEYKDKITKRS